MSVWAKFSLSCPSLKSTQGMGEKSILCHLMEVDKVNAVSGSRQWALLSVFWSLCDVPCLPSLCISSWCSKSKFWATGTQGPFFWYLSLSNLSCSDSDVTGDIYEAWLRWQCSLQPSLTVTCCLPSTPTLSSQAKFMLPDWRDLFACAHQSPIRHRQEYTNLVKG